MLFFFLFLLRAQHDHNKIAPCGMILKNWIELNSCNLPPAVLAKWPESFTCYCGKEWGGTATEIRVSAEKEDPGEEKSPAAPAGIRARDLLTLSLLNNVCCGCNLFPKEPCRRVRLARIIHFSRTWPLVSVDERPELEQGVPWRLLGKWETLRHGRHMTLYGQGKGLITSPVL